MILKTSNFNTVYSHWYYILLYLLCVDVYIYNGIVCKLNISFIIILFSWQSKYFTSILYCFISILITWCCFKYIYCIDWCVRDNIDLFICSVEIVKTILLLNICYLLRIFNIKWCYKYIFCIDWCVNIDPFVCSIEMVQTILLLNIWFVCYLPRCVMWLLIKHSICFTNLHLNIIITIIKL